MKYRILSVIVLIIILLISSTVSAAPVLDKVQYVLSGKVDQLNALNLNLDYYIDNINNFEARFTYHENKIKVGGSWIIDFLQRNNYDLNLRLSAATALHNFSLSPALGVGGDSDYLAHNKIFWEADYYFQQKDDFWTYQAGLSLPVTASSNITVGLGNSCWYPQDHMLNVGLKVDL